MTPKEKLNELINIFDMIICTDQDYKTQILMCVDYYVQSMINELEFINNWDRLEYWQEVKLEIEKL
jgi:hypothetical protein